MIPIDRKFRFRGYNKHTGTICTHKNAILFTAADNFTLDALVYYCQRLKDVLGVKNPQVKAVDLLIERVRFWRSNNPDLCKTPDVDPGDEFETVCKNNEIPELDLPPLPDFDAINKEYELDVEGEPTPYDKAFGK